MNAARNGHLWIPSRGRLSRTEATFADRLFLGASTWMCTLHLASILRCTPCVVPSQAVDQLVQCLTDEKYKGNMVCVVAGYVHEIDELMDANPGLASRFPETLHFPNFGVDDCCRMLVNGLKRKFSTGLTPEAAAALPQLLPPLVKVCASPL